MKAIITLTGAIMPHTRTGPKALLFLADNTIVGHIFNQLALTPFPLDEIILLTDQEDATEIETWVTSFESRWPIKVQGLSAGWDMISGLQACMADWQQADVLVINGDHIVNARYGELSNPATDAMVLTKERSDDDDFRGIALEGEWLTSVTVKGETPEVMVDVAWFRKGILQVGLAAQEGDLGAILGVLLAQGKKIGQKTAVFGIDTSTLEKFLDANKRLLALGYHSPDAIERSYAEDFTVIPPVFLHETAVIDRCVVGPYVSIGPDAEVTDSIVRTTIVAQNSVVENCVLEESFIGKNGRVIGKGVSFVVGDDADIHI